MNKMYLLLGLIFFFMLVMSSGVFAQSLFDDTTDVTQFVSQNQQDIYLDPKFTQISFTKSASFSSSPNIPLGWGIALNILPAFGLGSLIQGDKSGFLFQCSIELISATLGLLLIKYGVVSENSPDGSLMPGKGEVVLGTLILSLGMSTGVIFGLIKAILYDKKQRTASTMDGTKHHHQPMLSFDTNTLRIGYLLKF